MSDIEVNIKQESTQQEFNYSGDSIEALPGRVIVTIPKVDADLLDCEEATGQVMFTRPTGLPDATAIFRINVRELQKDGGYGD